MLTIRELQKTTQCLHMSTGKLIYQLCIAADRLELVLCNAEVFRAAPKAHYYTMVHNTAMVLYALFALANNIGLQLSYPERKDPDLSVPELAASVIDIALDEGEIDPVPFELMILTLAKPYGSAFLDAMTETFKTNKLGVWRDDSNV